MKRLALASVALVMILAFFAWRWMKISTDLDYFLPDGEGESRLASEVLRGLARAPLSRRIVVLVSANDHARVLAATRALQQELEALPLSMPSGEAAAESLITALFDHRYHFVSAQPEQELPTVLGREGILAAVAELKTALASPAGALVRAGATRDPLLLAQRPLQRLAAINNGGLQLKDGVLVTADGRHGVIFASSHAAPFDGQAQTQLWKRLEAAFAKVRASHAPVVIEASALARYAVAAEASMRRDVSRVAVASAFAVLALLSFVLVRLRFLPLLVLPLAAGFLGGTFACLALFGQIHAMTFAFGSALIGVCIDYPIHLINHMTMREAGDEEAMKSLRRSLLLGCLTTIVGLAAMMWGGLPGLRELAAFGTCGVLASLGATLLWLPSLVQSTPAAARHQRVARWAGRQLERVLAQRWGARAILVGAVGVCAWGLPQVVWQDDPQKLTSVDARLEAEDQRVRAAALGQEEGAFAFVVVPDDDESGLRANDRLAVALHKAVAAGHLQSFSSLHNVLWSSELQARNVRWVKENLQQDEILNALAGAGFVTSSFAPFGAEGADLLRPPLRPAELSPATQDVFVAPWSVPLEGGRRAYLARLSQVRNEAALVVGLREVSGSGYMNVAAFRAEAYRTFRERMLLLLGWGLVAVALLLLVVYRNWRLALCAFAPAVLSACLATAALTLMGVELNLMHLMGLLLVLSMGADYGIFIVALVQGQGRAQASALSLCLACASTVLSFGFLALSSSAALAAVGQSIGCGILLALLLAPVTSAAFLKAVPS